MSVAEAQQRISAPEFGEWIAFNRMSPIGRERGDVQTAVIASTIANVNRGAKQKAFTLQDFVLSWRLKQVKRVPWRNIKQTLMAFGAAHPGVLTPSTSSKEE